MERLDGGLLRDHQRIGAPLARLVGHACPERGGAPGGSSLGPDGLDARARASCTRASRYFAHLLKANQKDYVVTKGKSEVGQIFNIAEIIFKNK